ncbi:MAG: 16S rRNA (cytosine(967)-C(5))-methyltransferase RsmB [Clostridiales bacterium]|nr:16S rRNA (cytosine(967)-C(5))-methyltransferase RsmB [Clostridiales bacterium]
MKTREIAYHALFDVLIEKKYSNYVLEQALNRGDLSDKDRRLVAIIVMGTLQNYLYLIQIIKELSLIPFSKIKQKTRIILAIGLYQIMFLTKVPAYAIVNESVNLVSKVADKRAKAFVNGILRKAVDYKDKQEDFLKNLSKKEYLSIKYSFNMDIIHQLISTYGYDKTEKLLQNMNNYKKTCIRVNTMKISVDEVVKQLTNDGFVIKRSTIDEGLYISGNLNPTHHEWYKKGYYTLMDIGAMKVVKQMEPVVGSTILDGCASPGGKTTYLSQLIYNQGNILACDIHETRLSLLQENVKRMGSTNVICELRDLTKLQLDLIDKFDQILIDVPCSGIGVSIKRPEIKLNYEYNQDLIDTQKSILLQASKYVAPLGKITYATCTLLACENEGILNWFVKNNDFTIKKMEYIMPNEEQMGFFYGVLEKKV